MGLEIERKFLVVSDAWRADAGPPVRIRQGYVARGPGLGARVRQKGDRGFVTFKSGGSLMRTEFEYEIPFDDAGALLALCPAPIIEKTRRLWRMPDGHVWEIDHFASPVPGLVLAELELRRPDEPFDAPPWLGREVTDDPSYMNSELGRAPKWAGGG